VIRPILPACLVLWAACAAAQGVPFGGGAAPGTPVEVAAESLSIDRDSGLAVFEGGVVVGQGPLRLAADRVEVEYGEDRRIVRLRATGAVTLVSGEDAAEAREGTYDVDAGEIVMTGDVLLTQGEAAGGAALSADRLRVELATGRAELEGSVRTVLPVED
jgi:lipopolysaccharide export system protein LptA